MLFSTVMKRKSWIRLGTFVLLAALFVLGYWLFIRYFGPVNWGKVFSSRENLQKFVEQFDPYVPLVYFLIHTIQVIVAPIPGNVTALAGGAVFGLWEGFLLSTAGLFLGSCIAFGIARFYGRPVVEKLVKPKIIDKYIDTMANRHFVLLLIIFIFPFFPDDALCFIAGISALPFHIFLILVIIGRPPGMFYASLVGSGVAVIPWWGWVIIVAVTGLVLYLSYKYKDTLDRKLGIPRAEKGENDEQEH
jgi:uncharacterized membrane protein YdjX (TVP38/TMEM64 family)